MLNLYNSKLLADITGLTVSSVHKRAHNKAVSCRRSCAQKQLQIVKKISESVDIGISDDQQQQTELTPSSTDTTSAVKPVISANNLLLYKFNTALSALF